MSKYLKLSIAAVVITAIGVVLAFQAVNYWTHRFDELILRHAQVYRVEPKLVWSIIYEETYFRTTVTGDAGEIGLMQVTPAVAKEWAAATGLKEFEKSTTKDLDNFLTDPERNIQIGCWYLEKIGGRYRDYPAREAMTLAAYNAGSGRVEDWLKDAVPESLSEREFIDRIGIASTKSYVSSILARYRTTSK